MASPSTLPNALPTAAARNGAPTKVAVPTPGIAIVADVISYGYAALIVFSTLQFGLTFSIPAGVLLVVLYICLRGLAREIRRDAIRAAKRQARAEWVRRATDGPFNEEQRDGAGRLIDARA